MLDVLDQLEPNSVDAVVTDPPYEINFMNKGWDNTGIVFQKETWEKVLRVLKHGGHILAFNHSRTFHRMAVAIEDAGFQIRDTIMWLYGSGFPKSHDVSKAIDRQAGAEREVIGKRHENYSTKNGTTFGSDNKLAEYWNDLTTPSTEEAKQWDGWGSALKPSYEPIILARKPLDGTIADNTLKYGVGGLNIDECRVGYEDTPNPATNPKFRHTQNYKMPEKGQESNGAVSFTSSLNDVNLSGRFPANTIHDGSDEATKLMWDYETDNDASRYFYTSKTSKKDREEGLDSFNEKMFYRVNGGNGLELDPKFAPVPRKNIHPTVKPTDLMQYLIRLITPKGGTVLDPFMGSGSTGKAAMIENNERNADYYFVGIDINPEYIDIAKARIEYGINYKEHKAAEEEKQIVGDSQLKLEL
jgi:site-specific DNA-methyltransferase (adenine-specific)